MKDKILLMAAFTILVTGCSPMAASGSSQTALEARLNLLSCKVDYSSQQIDLIDEKIKDAPDLSAYKLRIQADIGQLKAYSSSGDAVNFTQYVESSLKPDMKASSDQLRAVKRDYKKYNLSKQDMDAVTTLFKSDTDRYGTCMNAASQKQGQEDLKIINTWMTGAQKKIDQLTSKDYDTSQLSSIMAEARTSYQTLAYAVSTKNSTKINEGIKEVRDQYLHACARFRGLELKLYLSKLQGLDSGKKYAAALNHADASADAALAIAVPGHKYTAEEFSTVWSNDLGDAAKIISETTKSIKADSKTKKSGSSAKGDA